MNLAQLSLKRPIFIICIVIVMLALGLMSMARLGVDQFPNITFPIVRIMTLYPGAGPSEIETLISKPLEDEIGTLGGIKRLNSINREGVSIVVAEFTLETDIKEAEQQIRDRVSGAKRKFPDGTEEPNVRRMDPADQPVLMIAMSAALPEGQLFDLADERIKPMIEQVNQVGLVEVLGGRKREIQVKLDRDKLKSYEISATSVASRIAAAGQNIPAGKVDQGTTETVFRSLGEFKSIKEIGDTVLNFMGNDVPVTVNDVGQVVDTLVDESSRTFLNGEKTLLLMVFKQSGANTIAVANSVMKQMGKLNEELKTQLGAPKLALVRDGAKPIRANVDDVKESIIIGIALTILVVFFFLGSGRSTLITGAALPNSLLGAFVLMAAAGFTINVMTLLALSLAVGLLVDDAIVVRENIFRHMEMGKSPRQAALEGTKEVSLAVIATTLTVIAVFGPIAFLQGVVGQFFKEFGLTICFAMLISLFDALTIAPMMSAYLAGGGHAHGAPRKKSLYSMTIGRLLDGFNWFQGKLEDGYERVLKFTIKRPILVIVGALLIFVVSIASLGKVSKTFLPAQDFGEFMVSIELAPGTNLNTMAQYAEKVDAKIRSNPEVLTSIRVVGSQEGANVAQFYLNLVPSKQRKENTSQLKERIRSQLKEFSEAMPQVKDIDMVGGGMRPFALNIVGADMNEIVKYSRMAYEKLKDHPGLKDVDFGYKEGKPEFQVVPDNFRAERLGVSTAMVGQELRTQIEGATPSVFRQNGREYDIRVRLKDDQRNLKESFGRTFVPNINQALVRVSDVAKPVDTVGPVSINRQDRGRYVQIGADVAPDGPGLGGVMADINKMFKDEIKLPPGMRYVFIGQAENFQELGVNMMIAAGLGVLFIFLVLASLYESFITPFTIMLVLPLAICGAFLGLFVANESLNIFSMIGTIMLLGIATKNSILLVDYANQQVAKGIDRSTALLMAGRARLRPILMTTVALIAGMLPVAIGLNEASKQRTSMGVAVIGGLISSTLLTLVVVPAAYSYIDRFRIWSGNKVKKWFGGKPAKETPATDEPAAAPELSH